MPDLKKQANVRVNVFVGETPGGGFGSIQISNDIDVPCGLTLRTGEIILRRINEMREGLVSDLMRESQ